MTLERTAFYLLSLCALDVACGGFHVWMVPMAVANACGLSWGWKYGRAT